MIFDTFLGESELPAKITYSFTEGRKAKINCLPEDSHPEEPPELELDTVMAFGFDLYPLLSRAVRDQLEDEALQDVINNAIDAAEQKADFDREQQRESKMEGYL